HKIDQNKTLVLGAIYSPKTKVTGNLKKWEQRVSGSTSIESYDYYTTKDSVFEMPETIGLGISFSKKNKYTIGADIQYQGWGDAKFFNKKDSLSNSLKINLGGEFIPDATSNNGLKRIRYRAGAYYSDSYVNVKGNGYKEYGVTLGFGFPVYDRRSFINLSFDYTAIRPEASWMVDEQYLKLTVSYTFNELWFFKRKIQ
ncbi:hypothetical protein LJB98_06255, partial [Bacteroidales bacterium OttesenSCG-928-M11]|nr:hypothetical protein [Bacteroidales bacterium OttesenSCG-928-M11]